MPADPLAGRIRARLKRDGVITFAGEAVHELALRGRRAVFSLRRFQFGSLGRGALIEPARILRGVRYMYVGDDVYIRSGARIEAFPIDGPPQLYVGRRTWIELDVQISCARSVIIGEDVLFGGRVFVSDNNHGIAPGEHRRLQRLSIAPVRIGDRVWVGQNACILAGVELGDDCVVAAGAVVTKSFPPATVVAGVPARRVGSVGKAQSEEAEP